MLCFHVKRVLCVALAAQLCSFLCAGEQVSQEETPELRRQLVLPRVTCTARTIRAVFAPSVTNNIRVRGSTVPMGQSEDSCGATLTREDDLRLTFTSRYDSCYIQIQDSRVVIPLQVQLSGEDQWFRVNISCPLIRRHRERTEPRPQTLWPGQCSIDRALRIDCGHPIISADACYDLGCCYDASDSTCYYRLNVCSLDGHVVFSVAAADTDPPVSPSSLGVRHRPGCRPAITTSDTAVFKFRVGECGAKMEVDGDVVTYDVEVEDLEREDRTRPSPFSLQVRCEYTKSDLKQAAGPPSLTPPTNPPPVVAMGTIRVQMRIATDGSFASFYPEDRLPLTLPLRQAAYVEVSIVQPSPDPALSLRVQDCFAYPASRHSVWMLLYDGCPNPQDDMRSSAPVDKQGRTSSHSQVRRFDVKTFAFLDPDTGHPAMEEMYFYCWVEICTEDCAQSCTLTSSDGERQRRETLSDQLQLVSLGPLLLLQGHDNHGHNNNNTALEQNPCGRQHTMFLVTVYVACGVGAALLGVLLFSAWSNIKKCRATKKQETGGGAADGQ